jgi:hypothetical protein
MLCLLPDFGKRENVAAVHRLSNLHSGRHSRSEATKQSSLLWIASLTLAMTKN